MSVFGSLFTAVSGLSAQSDSISMISNNIANVSTVGYKRTDASFSSLVISAGRTTSYNSGSVRSGQSARISQQGILQQTASPTDIAMAGSGFFVVSASTSAGAEPLYTRAGSFSEDANGILQNTSGFYLLGWPVDQNGTLPASQADISSLVPINLSALNNAAATTTTAAMALNLDSTEDQTPYPAGANFSPDFSRSITVYDSLGSSHNLSINFKKMATPTAVASGNVDLANMIGPLTDHGFNATDTFSINVGGVATTITLDGALPDMLADINAITDGDNQPLLYAQIDENGYLTVKARNPGQTVTIADGSGTPLAALGLGTGGTYTSATAASATGTNNVSAYTAPTATEDFDITIDGITTTISITTGDDINDVLAQLNAITGVHAQLNTNNRLVINADDDITLTAGAGTLLADMGLTAGTYETSDLDMLTATSGTPSTEGWWMVEFRDESGSAVEGGLINFSGNGQLNATKDLQNKVLIGLDNIDWGNGAALQDIDFDLAGFTQFSGQYNVISSTQNGAELGLRTGVAIDENGFVIAQFSNGQTSKIYKLAVATFANVNGLTEVTGNVFRESGASGSYNLREAGQGSAGQIASGALEASNVDLADEFSKMIVTQRAYSANTKVISTADQMMQELMQLR